MSRKNNAKLYKARHAAALERNRESLRRSEARKVRREHMRLLTKGLAELGCFSSDKAPSAALVSTGTSASSSSSLVPSSSSSSSLSASSCRPFVAADRGEETRAEGSSAASTGTGGSTPEKIASQKDAGKSEATANTRR